MATLHKKSSVFLDTLGRIKPGDALTTVWHDVNIENEKKSAFTSLSRYVLGDSRIKSIALVEEKTAELREICALFLRDLAYRACQRKLAAYAKEGKEEKSVADDWCVFSKSELQTWLESLCMAIPKAIIGALSLKFTYANEKDDSMAKFLLCAKNLAMLFNSLIKDLHIESSLIDIAALDKPPLPGQAPILTYIIVQPEEAQ